MPQSSNLKSDLNLVNCLQRRAHRKRKMSHVTVVNLASTPSPGSQGSITGISHMVLSP
jgi:hypothetical protein